MKASIGHVGINLSSKDTLAFWKELCSFFGFSIEEEGEHFDANDGQSYLCVSVSADSFSAKGFHRKKIGLNHIAFQVESKEAVDQFVTEFLKPREIDVLYGGARAYPEYLEGYYAVYFEDPDRIKVEVVYEPQ